jgi:aminopeptidase N
MAARGLPAGWFEGKPKIHAPGASWVGTELRALVAEASRALARLDAERLEELALSCRALNRELAAGDGAVREEVARQAAQARGEMEVFERVLDATRANLAVLNRARERREGRGIEYGRPDPGPRGSYGDD